MNANDLIDRAQGCLLGQLVGDALGSQVEFMSPQAILRQYPDGVRDLADGGQWDTLAGQPTDDSEMALAIATGCPPEVLYRQIRQWTLDMETEPKLLEAVISAEHEPPLDYRSSQGWVLIALHNALWQLLHAPSFEEALVDTVMRGGDTDTNAAICGALLGAVHGLQAIPTRWVNKVLNCRPRAGLPGVRRPRPEWYWPVDALDLAMNLVQGRP